MIKKTYPSQHFFTALIAVFVIEGIFHSKFSFSQTVTEQPAIQASLPTLELQVGQKYPLEGFLPNSLEVTPSSIVRAIQTPEGVLLVALAGGHAKIKAVLEDRTKGNSQLKTIEIPVLVRQDSPNREFEQTEASDMGKGLSIDDSWEQVLGEIKKMPGLTIKRFGPKTLIQGEILGRKAYQKLLLHLSHYPNKILLLASPAPGIKASLIEQLTQILHRRGFKNLSIINAGNRFFLEGRVNSPSEVDQAIELAQSVLPNIENHVPLPIQLDPTISIRVFMLELSKQAHEELGLSWSHSVPDAILVQTPTGFAFSGAWLATLKHLSTAGKARVLAEPMLSVKNGSSAELSAGGEIPIRITGRFENKVVWKNYGLKLKVKIKGIAGKSIRTQIETQSSHLDEATAVDGVPGIRHNNLNTEVDAVDGTPLLLTGVFQSSSAKDVKKFPILGSIPILGEIFKSRRFREHESEILIALLPSMVSTQVTLPLRSYKGLDFDKKWKPLN